jgi:pilus assembly protein FimV
MQRSVTTLALLLALGLGTDDATALGLGKVGGAAVLGQPLSVTVGLRLDANETLDARCVKTEISFGERSLPDNLVRTRLETASTTGERRLRVSTTVAVDEPVVALHLHLGCPPSLSRNLTLLADPPGAVAAESGSEGWQPDRADTTVSPVLSAVPGAGPAPAAAPAQRARRSSAASSEAPRRPRPAAPPARSSGPVLRLDPVEADALILPQLQMETRLSLPPQGAASGAAAAYLDPETAQRREEQERLKAMEAALLKLRADSEATQKSLDQMQARVRAAEASRYANPLVYLLVFLCVLLAGALVAMGWLRRRDRAAAAWWADQPAGAVAAEPLAEGLAEPEVPSVLGAAVSVPQALPSAVPVGDLAPAVPAAPAPAVPVKAAEPESGIEPRRPMSAEELIDLEQQAEFFVVLGQDEAAIDLLMGHVRSTGGVSPLPYLKLLEIYRRRGEREPYDRIRERFNRRFNAYAPEWDVDPELGLSLEGYPEVMQRLQDTWNRPSQAMGLLDAALFRRDAGPTFDVPAYRELLFLYSTARDLAERDVDVEGVDLLLPIGDVPSSTMTSVAASPEVADPPASFSLDLDVSTDQPPLTLEDLEPQDLRKNER